MDDTVKILILYNKIGKVDSIVNISSVLYTKSNTNPQSLVEKLENVFIEIGKTICEKLEIIDKKTLILYEVEIDIKNHRTKIFLNEMIMNRMEKYDALKYIKKLFENKIGENNYIASLLDLKVIDISDPELLVTNTFQ